MHDPAGVDFTLRFVDRVARPADDHVAARELARLAGPDAPLPDFIGGADRALLRTGARLAPRAPRVVVPLARRRLRGPRRPPDRRRRRPRAGASPGGGPRRGLPAEPQPARRGGARRGGGRPSPRAHDGPAAPRRRRLRLGEGVVGGEPARAVGPRGQPRPARRAPDPAVPSGARDRLLREPRHGGVQGPRPHRRPVHDPAGPPRVHRAGGRDRAAGLPPRRPRRAGGAGRVRPPPGRGGGRADQGPAGQGREPRDGEGRRRGARLAAGAVHDEGRGRRELRAPARPGDRGRPRRRAAPRRREPPPPPRRAGRRARRRPRRRAPDRRRDAAGHGAGAGEGGGARRAGAARALHAGGARRRLRRRRLLPRAPARGERLAGELPLRAVLRRRARLVHRPLPGLGARPRRGAGDAEALRARE